MSIHLAIVTPLPPIRSSIGQYGYYISEALARTGNFEQITLLAQTAPNAQQTDSKLPFQVERLWDLNRLDASLKISSRLKQVKPDLIWYNLGVSIFGGQSPLSNAAGLLSPALSKMIGIPTVITLHESIAQADLPTLHVPGGRLTRWGASLIQYICTQADLVCVTLHRHAEYLSQNNPNIQVMHIPHGTFTSPTLLASSSNLEFLFFGYIAPFKGLELLLKVFSDLYSRYPSLSLTIAGGEHPRFPGYLQHIRSSCGENPAIRWLGYVPEIELRQVFARAAIVILPSTATTGSSSVLYRAAAWGRPIVASDLPELRASAEEERLWVEFFPSGDDVGLRTALERLLVDSERRTNQAYHNYHIIKEHLTLAHTCQAYLKAFEIALINHK
jgi:glycosyltransferase involved in cell wall biosynthesis